MKKDQGFTLIELMVTMAIFAVLAAVAVINLIGSRPQRQLQSAARQIYADTQKCKIAAAKERMRCALSFGETADTDYLIYLDADNSSTYSSSETIIASGKWSGYPTVSLSGTPAFTLNSDGNPTIAFRSTGIPTSPSGGFGNGSVTLKNTKNDERKLTINRNGNIRLE